MVANWHPQLLALVDESDPASLLAIPLQTSEPVAAWPTTPVTLLGDAIHTMTPLQGLGGNTALHDARNLVAALTAVHKGAAELVPALAAYEADMRTCGFAAVRQSLEVTQAAVSHSRLQRQIFKTILRTAEAVPALKSRIFSPAGRH
jgi:2-polyprenyl-6-methoxyphenol hydroxylase-like FAD-dependent oxidoreductase